MDAFASEICNTSMLIEMKWIFNHQWVIYGNIILVIVICMCGQQLQSATNWALRQRASRASMALWTLRNGYQTCCKALSVMKEGGMEQVVKNCWKSQKMSSGKYHHLLPLWELNSVPFHVEMLLFNDDICLKLSVHWQRADQKNVDGIISVIGRFEEM